MFYYSLFILNLPHIVGLTEFSVTKLFQVPSDGRVFFFTMEWDFSGAAQKGKRSSLLTSFPII